MKNAFLAVIVGVMVAGCGGADTQSVSRGQASKEVAVGAKPTICDTGDGWWNGPNPITNGVSVPAGAICRIAWVEVQGNTIVSGSLYTIGSTFDGNVVVDGGCLTTANWGNTFHGNVSIMNSPGCNLGGAVQNGFWSPYSPTTIAGNFSYVNNSVPLYIGYGPATVGGKFTYSGSPCDPAMMPTSVGGASAITCK